MTRCMLFTQPMWISVLEPVMNFGWSFVGFKTGCRQGAARAHPQLGLKASRNAAASPFWFLAVFSG